MSLQITGLTETPVGASARLTRYSKTSGLFIDVDRCIDYKIFHTDKARQELTDLRTVLKRPFLSVTKQQEMLNILLDELKVPAHLLTHRKRYTTSWKVLEPLLELDILNEKQKYVIKTYLSTKKSYWLVSHLNQYLELPLLNATDYKGNRMVIANPNWNILTTGRLSADTPSLQNMPWYINDIITKPKGFELLFTDSGQIEPRIQYSAYIKDKIIKHLIELHDDAYYGQLQYLYMSADEIKEQEKLEVPTIKPFEITEDWEERRKDFKTILLKGSYGSAMTDVDPELVALFRSRILEHPEAKRREAEIREYVEQGGTTFYSAFGREIKPNLADYEEGTYLYKDHLVKCGLNNPNQGTAADLMNMSVKYADEYITNNMRTTAAIAYYKHDEGAFYISEDEMSDKTVETFRNFLSYEVTIDGEKWIPIRSDLKIGQKDGDLDVPRY